MRLGQLARVVALKPKELISFLEEKGINNYTHANSKLSQEDESFILDHFGKKLEKPEEVIEIKKTTSHPPDIPSASVEDIPVKEELADAAEEASVPVNKETEPEASPSSNSEVIEEDKSEVEEVEEVELIKAPKIELPGLKVVGKIELPEPPKKETTEKAEDTEASNEKNRRRKPGDRNRKTGTRRNQDPDYNPIKEKREREKRRKERKLEEQKKKEKQKKAQHYYGKVAPQQAKSNPKKKPVQPASYSQVVLENEKKEKQNIKKGNVLVRLWRWLNTY